MDQAEFMRVDGFIVPDFTAWAYKKRMFAA